MEGHIFINHQITCFSDIEKHFRKQGERFKNTSGYWKTQRSDLPNLMGKDSYAFLKEGEIYLGISFLRLHINRKYLFLRSAVILFELVPEQITEQMEKAILT